MKKTIKNVSILLIVIMFCLVFAFSFQSKAPQTVYADETTTLDVVEKKEIGYAINVVKARYVNDITMSNMVLDPIKRDNLEPSKITLNQTPMAMAYSYSDIRQVAGEFSREVGAELGLGNLIGAVGGAFDASASFDFSTYAYKYMYVYSQETFRYTLSLDNYGEQGTYENLYSSYYIADLGKVADGTMSYTAFFDKYGTHLIGSAIYGGRVDAYYTLASNEIVINPQIASEIGATVGTNVTADIVATAKTKASNVTGISYSSSSYVTAYGLEALGGDPLSATTISNLPSQISTWLSSLNNDEEAVIVDYNNGLVPLWDILPEQYESLSSNMRAAYNSYYYDAEDELIDEFKDGNYVHFDGGNGTEEDPFRIENAEQLRNIESTSMKMHYELVMNIDLSSYSQWVPIGGFYKEKAFTGTLEGNNLKISGLTRTADITEVNNRIYFGLFGYIGAGGVVKNIDFQNVNIAMTGPSVNNANTRVFVGVVAGTIYGSVSGIDIISGSCSYDANTNGNAYVGGIAGVVREGNVTMCTNNIPITAGRHAGVAGGIAGYSTGGTFTNCYNYKTITAKCKGGGGAASAGGIVGERCSNTGYVTTFNSCASSGELKTQYYSWGIGHTFRTGTMYAKDNSAVYD